MSGAHDHVHGSAATRGALFGLGAALLFGCGTPLAKLLLAEMPPLPLSGRATGFLALHELVGKMPGVTVKALPSVGEVQKSR